MALFRSLIAKGVWVGVLLAALPGCQGEDPQQKAFAVFVDDQVASKQEIATVLAAITDQATMKAAEPRLKKLAEKEELLKRHALIAPTPSRATVEKLKGKIEDLQSAWKQVIHESQRIRSLPGGEAFLEQLFPSTDKEKKPFAIGADK